MAYFYNEVRALKGKAKVDGGECVALARHFTRAPQTALWRQGAAVIGNKTLAAGTAIATFVNGKYPNRPKGNHSAFYLGQVSNGMYIMDQWPADTKKDISPRFIYRKGFRKDGTAFDPSDNADAFSVIE